MEPEPQVSMLQFYYNALGLKYAILLPFCGLLSFVLTAIVVFRGRGAAMGATLLFAVAIPLWIGVQSTVDGLIGSYMVIASSPTVPKPSELAQGISMSLVSLWFGMFLALPSYFLAAGGAVVRALVGEKSR